MEYSSPFLYRQKATGQITGTGKGTQVRDEEVGGRRGSCDLGSAGQCRWPLDGRAQESLGIGPQGAQPPPGTAGHSPHSQLGTHSGGCSVGTAMALIPHQSPELPKIPLTASLLPKDQSNRETSMGQKPAPREGMNEG